MYPDSIGTLASTDYLLLAFSRSTTLSHGVVFASDGFYRRTGASTYTEVGNNIVDKDAWTTWRIKICTVTNKMWLWKNGVLVAENVDEGYTTTGLTAGRTALLQYGYALSGARTYVDYIRIYSEDGTLLQTVIE